MKKLFFPAIIVTSLTFFACQSKPAADNSADESANVESAEQISEQPVEEAPLAEEPTDSIPATDSLATDSLAVEPLAEQPAPEQSVAEEPAPSTPSDKTEIVGSDGNFVAFVNEIVTADADGCIKIAFVLDKVEESFVALVVQIETLDGSKIALYPIKLAPGGTKGNVSLCASSGGVLSKLTPGERYKLSFTRTKRL
jgi:hypothetical protein